MLRTAEDVVLAVELFGKWYADVLEGLERRQSAKQLNLGHTKKVQLCIQLVFPFNLSIHSSLLIQYITLTNRPS
jgi:hypothetical protein